MPRGRPKGENPRDQVIRFRVTQAEYEQLQRAGYQHRPILSPGEYARLVVLAQIAGDGKGSPHPPSSQRISPSAPHQR